MLNAALAIDSEELLKERPDAKPCSLFVKTYREPVLVGGRYLKLKRGVSQSPWSVPPKPGEYSVQVIHALISAPPGAICSICEDVVALPLTSNVTFSSFMRGICLPEETKETLDQEQVCRRN